MSKEIAVVAKTFADELLSAVKDLTSCSGDVIKNYTGAAHAFK